MLIIIRTEYTLCIKEIHLSQQQQALQMDRQMEGQITDNGLIEPNTTLREGRGNSIQVSKICNPR